MTLDQTAQESVGDSPVRVGIGLATMVPGQMTGTAAYVGGLFGAFSRDSRQVCITAVANPDLARWVTENGGAGVRIRTTGRPVLGRSRARLRLLSNGIARSHGSSVARGLDVMHYPLTLGLPHVARPSLMSLHDVLHLDHPELFSPSQRIWRRVAYDRAAKQCTHLMTISDTSRERIIEHLGIAPERVTVVHFGVDGNRFSPNLDPLDAELLDAMNVPERFIVYPAALWPHKDHDVLLRALARVDDSIGLVLTGPTYGKQAELEALATSLGLADRVTHLGFVPEHALPALYRRAEVLVFPSRYEGFGIPLIEAMASGCPVVASAERPMSDICGRAALLVEPGDDLGFARAIEMALQPATASRLAADGIQRAGLFSWDAAADQHAALYRQVAGQQ